MGDGQVAAVLGDGQIFQTRRLGGGGHFSQAVVAVGGATVAVQITA